VYILRCLEDLEITDYECLKKKKKKNRIMNLGGEMIGVINLVTK
jgi:hypothetical protein